MIGIMSYIVFSAMSGYLEAYFWAEHPKVNQRRSHIALTVFRAVVMAPIAWYEGLVTCIGLAFLFPFIHDGFYYQTRNKINNNTYPLGWMDESNSTGAVFSFGFLTRVIFASIGIIIISLC